MNLRETPADFALERHVIGAALLSPENLGQAVGLLTEDDFFIPRHAAFYRAMRELQAKGVEFGLEGLLHVLQASGRLQDGDEGALWEISGEVLVDTGFSHNLQLLRDLSARRRLIHSLGTSLESAYDLGKPFQEVQEQAEAAVLAVGESRKSGPRLRTMGQVLGSASKEWQAVAQGQPGGLLSRIEPLDALLLGFRPGKFYVLAARPGLGKSMLALQVMAQCGQPAAGYSLEMLAEEQAERMISQESDMNSDSLRSPNVLMTRQKELAAVVSKLAALPITWVDEAVTPAQILAQCRRLKKANGLGLVVVDYLQLMKAPGKFDRRDLEVGAVSKALKAMAMKLHIPVLAIASLSRRPEERTDKRPLLSDLKESGEIESDADAVMFLYRESDYNPEAKRRFPNVTELTLAKNRGGKKGRVLLEFDGAHSKFYALHQESTREYLEFIEGKRTAAPAAPVSPYRSFYGRD